MSNSFTTSGEHSISDNNKNVNIGNSIQDESKKRLLQDTKDRKLSTE
ncbi:MAG: hypothetical protein MR601_04495 [Erysipelotrichaceae bacterium]|nr:hypothetical protein [Erysipelotrichaceae bacterium]